MLKFKAVKIQGFGSVDELVYPLDNIGVNIIKGPNGAGKSTIPAAILWAISGKLIGKDQVEPWEDVRSKKFVGTKVSLRFKSGHTYQITRCYKYKKRVNGSLGANRLILYKDGVVLEHLRNKGDVQKEINKIIGLSFEILCNSIILGQNITRILDEKGDRQKLILDEAFNTLYIQKARDKAKKDRASKLSRKVEVDSEVNKYTELLDNNKRVYKTLLDRQQYFLEEKQREVERLKEKIEKNKVKLGEVKLLEKKHQALQEEKSKLEEALKILLPAHDAYTKAENYEFKQSLLIAQAEGQIEDLEQEKKKIKNKFHSKCPTCGQKIHNANEYKAHIQKEVSKKNDKIIKLKEKIKEQTKSYKYTIRNKDYYGAKTKEYGEIKTQVERISQEISKLGYYPQMELDLEQEGMLLVNELKEAKSRDYEDGSDVLEVHKKLIRKHRLKLKPLKKEQKTIGKEIELLDWLINEPLSNKGLKAFIFNQLLEDVSERTNYYAQYSGYALDFKIDLESATKPLVVEVFNKGKSRPYKSISGGQKQLANITASFAIHDIVTQNRGINLIFMDEIFENLDKHNIQVVSDLIAFRAKTQAVHLITHRVEFNIPNASITEVRLNKKGITEIAA